MIFASNTIAHILSGKAVARAMHGNLLLDTALNKVLMQKLFSHQVNGTSVADDPDDESSMDSSTDMEIQDDNTSEDTDPLSDSVLMDEEIPLSTKIQELLEGKQYTI